MSHRTTDETLVERLTNPSIPLDLVGVAAYVAVADALLLRPDVYGSPLAVAVAVPLLFFVPGYALVAALFPGATPDDALADRTVARVRQHGLGGGERLALGFGVSVALLPPLGIALAASPWSIAPVTVLLSVSGFAVACAAVAAVRRLRRPSDRRFSLPLGRWASDARSAVLGESVPDALLNVALAVGVLLAATAIGYAVAAPGPGQRYTNVYLLSQNETGELVAADYPENFTNGESKPIVVGLDNHEGREVDYTVVVELQRVREGPDGGATVLQDRRLAQFTPTVGAGETWRTRHDVTPSMTGQNLRLVYLVYEGAPPEDTTTANADEYVHVWIDVTE